MFFGLIFAVILEQILSQIIQWKTYDETNFILLIELLAISVFMTFSTVLLLKMINEIFGSDFVDEKFQFKISLLVFVSTYSLHCLIYSLAKSLPEIYAWMWTNRPFITECLFIFVQLIYDVLPLTMIFRQHHNHFKTEDMDSTTFIMRSSTQKHS